MGIALKSAHKMKVQSFYTQDQSLMRFGVRPACVNFSLYIYKHCIQGFSWDQLFLTVAHMLDLAIKEVCADGKKR